MAGRNSRGTLKAMRSSAVVTVSSLTSKRAAEGVDDLVDERFRRRGARRHADAFDALDLGPRDVAGALDQPRVSGSRRARATSTRRSELELCGLPTTSRQPIFGAMALTAAWRFVVA